jgi:hypothetical protein
MGCPASPVNLNLELLFCAVDSPAISVSGNTISMSPDIPLTAVIVNGITGTKWVIYATAESGFSGPITYGTVPSGAAQGLPVLNATPQALTTGDTIMVAPLGGTVPYQGRQCYSNSMYTVP